MAIAQPTPRDVAPIQRQLGRLRRSLFGWIVIAGIGRLLVAALILAALDMLLDRVFRMDFAQRAIMLGLLTAALLVVVYRVLFRPLERKPSDNALVLEVERQHRQFDESVISSWQFARQESWRHSGVSPDLVRATIDRGVRDAQSIDFAQALDRKQQVAHGWVLAAGLVAWGLLAWGITSNDFLKTWFDRNVLLGASQWPQSTYLEIEGVTNGELVVDRGSNYDLNVTITPDSRVTDVDVDVEFDSDGKRTVQRTNPTGRMDGRQRQLTLHNVNSEFRLRASGGDAVTEWVSVRLVEPLDLSELRLNLHMPPYVGGTRELTGGGPHSILAGSELEILATTNVPVARVQLRHGSTAATDLSPNATEVANEPGREVIPLQQLDESHYRQVLGSAEGGDHALLIGGKYAIELFDETGRRNLRPLAFEIAVVADKPPKVVATLSGISGLVVPRANLPISFRATDPYGLVQASVPYLWRTNDEANALREGELYTCTLSADQLRYAEAEQEFSYSGDTIVDLRPLQLPTGIVLRFHVAARDNQPDAEAGLGRSREFLLRVVSEEELRADLLRREVEQRALFQQNRDNQLQLMTELRALAAAVAAEPARDVADRQRQLLELRNRQKNIGTNLYQIAGRFSDFLAEAINNRLDESETELQREIQDQTPSLVSFKVRYAQRIIDPLRALDETEIYLAMQGLEEARNQLGTTAPFSETALQTAELQESIVRKMDQILAAMEESQTYQEIVNRVIALKRLEQSLLESIKNKQQSTDRPSIFD